MLNEIYKDNQNLLNLSDKQYFYGFLQMETAPYYLNFVYFLVIGFGIRSRKILDNRRSS